MRRKVPIYFVLMERYEVQIFQKTQGSWNFTQNIIFAHIKILQGIHGNFGRQTSRQLVFLHIKLNQVPEATVLARHHTSDVITSQVD